MDWQVRPNQQHNGANATVVPYPGAAARVASCPVCASARIAPFMVVSDNGHLRSENVKLQVFRCAGCDLLFLNPAPPPEIGRQYFAEAYRTDSGSNIYYKDEFKERASSLRLDLITSYRSGSRLLDVGCGKGQFVQVAKARGWDAWGVELDEGACVYASERLGLTTVLNGSLDHEQLPGEFDVVTLWDVIEHVPDPVGILRSASKKLRTGGLIVVRTANVRSWTFDKHRHKWWAFGSDHRFYFSPGSLSVAMRSAGFDAIQVFNRELTERPDRRRSRDISETGMTEGLKVLARSPAKLGKAGLYVRNLARRLSGELRHGEHYHTSIMTVVAEKNR